jgi:hypothetical protein
LELILLCKVAMAYAARHPNTLSKLIVVDIAPKCYPHNDGPIGEVATVIKSLNELPLDTIHTR